MKTHKGFTLMELLIVIVIIGILASTMMLSSGSTSASARASTIITDLRSLKAAAMMFYMESMDAASDSDMQTAITANGIKLLAPFLENPGRLDENYEFIHGGTPVKWYVSCGNISDTRVQEKLKDKAKSVGLFSATFDTYTGGEKVCMIAK